MDVQDMYVCNILQTNDAEIEVMGLKKTEVNINAKKQMYQLWTSRIS